MRALLTALVFSFVFAGNFARAEVSESSASGMLLHYETTVAASPNRAYQALAHIGRWWDSVHSYSGDSHNFSLDLRAGGCFCERWGANSVEHGRVIMAFERDGVRTVRMNSALGPLQETGATGILTFTIAPDPQGAKITMTYRVSGDPSLNFANMAAAVDHVLGEQFGRFSRYTASGAPS